MGAAWRLRPSLLSLSLSSPGLRCWWPGPWRPRPGRPGRRVGWEKGGGEGGAVGALRFVCPPRLSRRLLPRVTDTALHAHQRRQRGTRNARCNAGGSGQRRARPRICCRHCEASTLTPTQTTASPPAARRRPAWRCRGRRRRGGRGGEEEEAWIFFFFESERRGPRRLTRRRFSKSCFSLRALQHARKNKRKLAQM